MCHYRIIQFEQCLHVVFERPSPCWFRGCELCEPVVVEELLDACILCRTWPNSYERYRVPPLPAPDWEEVTLPDGTIWEETSEDDTSEETDAMFSSLERYCPRDSGYATGSSDGDREWDSNDEDEVDTHRGERRCVVDQGVSSAGRRLGSVTSERG